MNRIVCWMLIVVITMNLSGCWDSKDIQELQYITGLGVDYKDDKYIIYGQVMSFSGVAKQEGSQTVPTPVWVVKGSGKTVVTAMNDVYRKANQSIYWGHIGVVIYTENVLKKGINKVNDGLLRFQQIRETVWVYGTNEPIEQILLVTSIFGSPYQTSLYSPKEVYKIRSLLPPLRVQRFYVDYNEPGMTVKLPLIKIKKNIWKAETEERSTAKLSGVYLLKNKKLKGILSEKEMMGLRWVTEETIRSPLLLKVNDDLDLVVSIMRPKVKIMPIFENGDVRFDMKLKFKANVTYMNVEVTLDKLKKEIKKKIHSEIMESFKYGLEKGVDVYNLEQIVYRKDIKQWKKLFENKNYKLSSESINSIDIHVTIKHTGDYKFYPLE